MRRITIFFWILSGVGFGMFFGVALASSAADMVRPVVAVGIFFAFAGLVLAELSNVIQNWLDARRAAKKAAAPVAAPAQAA